MSSLSMSSLKGQHALVMVVAVGLAWLVRVHLLTTAPKSR